MELSSILDALSEDTRAEQVKTAAHVSQSHSSQLEAALDSALSMDKTASYAGSNSAPSEDLIKIAQKLADAEQLALVKEAEMYGAAVCDGFLARMNEHDSNGVKVASFSGGGGGDVDEMLIKHAMELGYRETQSELQKLAQQAYSEGYAEQTKVASAALQQGYNETTKIASAALQEGYAEGQKMIKVAAENCAQRGYQHALNILGSLA
jgi:hypothetical protein